MERRAVGGFSSSCSEEIRVAQGNTWGDAAMTAKDGGNNMRAHGQPVARRVLSECSHDFTTRACGDPALWATD
jgi:hypothetical protein